MKISTKINLLQLKAAVINMKTKSGMQDCLVMPIAGNNLFHGEKGVYLDLTGFDIQKKEGSKDTHLIKQSLPKEVREKMTEEEIKAMPILGNHQIWGEHTEPEVQSSSTAISEKDDLPF